MADIEKIASVAGQVALDLFVPGYMKAAYSALTSSQNEVIAAQSKGLGALEEEAKKKKIVMDFQAHRARVAQELAIAQRISASHEVVIEEYYESSGKGHVGVKADNDAVSLGASGEGQRVTKRVFRFSGGGGGSEHSIPAEEA